MELFRGDSSPCCDNTAAS